MEKEIKNMEEKEEVKNELVLSGDFGVSTSQTEKKYYTTIDVTDTKKLYNLDNGQMDHLLNDCEGESIRVVDVLIKEFRHKLEEPIISDDGEVIDYEVKKACILIDDRGETYVTGSKMFTNQMKRFIGTFGIEEIKNGLDIKIVKKKMSDSNNKALAFELI